MKEGQFCLALLFLVSQQTTTTKGFNEDLFWICYMYTITSEHYFKMDFGSSECDTVSQLHFGSGRRLHVQPNVCGGFQKISKWAFFKSIIQR